jgi:hypothetical protein
LEVFLAGVWDLNCKALTFYFHPKRNKFPPSLRDRSRGVNVTTPLNSRDAELNGLKYRSNRGCEPNKNIKTETFFNFICLNFATTKTIQNHSKSLATRFRNNKHLKKRRRRSSLEKKASQTFTLQKRRQQDWKGVPTRED